jgi:hypothetical protein
MAESIRCETKSFGFDIESFEAHRSPRAAPYTAQPRALSPIRSLHCRFPGHSQPTRRRLSAHSRGAPLQQVWPKWMLSSARSRRAPRSTVTRLGMCTIAHREPIHAFRPSAQASQGWCAKRVRAGDYPQACPGEPTQRSNECTILSQLGRATLGWSFIGSS